MVVLGALIAPPFYWLGQAAVPFCARQGWVVQHEIFGVTIVTGRFSFIASNFRRYFDRAILVAAFALLWPLISSLRIGGWSGLGLRANPRRFRDFTFGLLVSSGSVVVLGFLAVGAGFYSVVPEIPWKEICLLPLSALAVALIEESLFRGAIQGAVQRAASRWSAVLFVSALYALVHFLKPPDMNYDRIQVAWFSGFLQAIRAFSQFQQPMLVLGGFVTLFLVGLILSYSRLQTASLWMPVGLHTGWIIAKMGFSKIADTNGIAWPWFGPDFLVGLAPTLAVLAAGALVWWNLKPKTEVES